VVGLKIDIVNFMTNNKNEDENNHKINNVIELLKFALSLDDEEIIKSTVESVIEILQEIVQ
jgi:hypothetical protein